MSVYPFISYTISDSVDKLKLFTLVNSEGKEITEKEQLGLLLYRGGTVCGLSDFKVADAICKEMNFTRAETWTTDVNFDIQSNYLINLKNVGGCGNNAEWERCYYSESTLDCNHNTDVFLSCTGDVSLKHENNDRRKAIHLTIIRHMHGVIDKYHMILQTHNFCLCTNHYFTS